MDAQEFDILGTQTAHNTHLCCTDILALYFTIHHLKKLCDNALYVCYCTLVLAEDGST